MSGELTPAGQGDLAARRPAVPPSAGHLEGGWAPPPESDAEANLDLVAAWSTVRRNWRLVLLMVVLGGLAGLAWTYLTRPVYRAISTLAFEQRRTSLPALDALSDISAGDEVSTEMEVLRSRSLAEAVIDSLGLRLVVAEPRDVPRSRLLGHVRVPSDLDSARLALSVTAGTIGVRWLDGQHPPTEFSPGEDRSTGGVELLFEPGVLAAPDAELAIVSSEAAFRAFGEGLSVNRPNRDASIVEVEFRGSDAVLVANVVNTLAAKYLARRQDVRKTTDRSTVAFLRQQLDTLDRQLRASEEALRRFREQHGVVSLAAEATTQVERLVELRIRRAEVEAERQALERILHDAQGEATGGDSPYRRLLAFPTLIRSQTTASMLELLAELENERGRLLGRRTPDDPDVRAVDARIRGTEERAEALVSTYLGGLRSQVTSLDTELAGFAAALDRVPAKEVEFARLERTVQVLTGIYTTLQTRLKEAEVAQAVEDASVQVVDRAQAPQFPIWPKRSLLLGLGVIVGLVIGLTIGFTREAFDSSIHAIDDAQAAAGAPVLGMIPRVARARGRRHFTPLSRPSRDEGRLLPSARTTLEAAEAFRSLRTNLLFTTPERGARVLVFTSAAPEEGKSTCVINLAWALAEQGSRVVVVDADLRRGELHREANVARAPGLSDLLVGRAQPEGVLHSLVGNQDGRVSLMPTGTLPPHPAQLLGSPGFPRLVKDLLAGHDFVLLDTPPLNLFTDAALAGVVADGVVLVARAERTRRGELAYAADQLRRLQLPLIGVVLSAVDRRRSATYGGRYYAGEYRYEATGEG